MCGRYVMSKATSDLLSHFDAKEVEGNPPGPSWNVAPTQNVPHRSRICRGDSESVEGFGWSNSVKGPCILPTRRWGSRLWEQ
ncbi:SOS response-associated peptidase family protein [Paenarthrobacter histidinolovorans]|uniref:SOS response-associated peptidase family protein n=1 Tax=Paenarthrobacter histidinolovorans TaxID=43664 RepID=UPI00227B95C9|nr:SOS response-associated peptidase family protein [Paenarthrobacter histidinolovorans]